MIDTPTGTYNLRGHTLELYVLPGKVFTPNAITTRFSRGIEGVTDAIVYDIGFGIGPLTIWAALEGARKVYGTDPVAEHVKFASMNVSKYGLEDRVHISEGNIFSTPEGILDGMKADIIIGDVSGIADKAARALGWYPENVPTGGEDGTDVVTALLESAPKYLTGEGVLYFAISIGLSDHQKVIDVANKQFNSVIPLRDTPLFFPFSEDDVKALKDVYKDHHPDYIKIIEQRGRHGWQGQMFKVSSPKQFF